MKLILGSASVGRRMVMEQAGYKFEVMTADIDEKSIRSDDYYHLPLFLARAKSDALRPRLSEKSILITADQVVICNRQLREKPESEAQAREFLRSYSIYPAETVNAVVVYNSVSKKSSESVTRALVYFRHIPEEIIEKVVREGSVMNAAGGFKTEHPILGQYLIKIDGDRDSVIGLQIKELPRLIQESS